MPTESVTVAPVKVAPTVVPPVKFEATTTQTVEYLVYFVFGVIEALLLFRMFFKLTGASVSSGFVTFIYNITNVFGMPFEGIFHKAVTNGIETKAVFEPATLVAIIVYSILAWGIVQLVRIFSGEQQPSEN